MPQFSVAITHYGWTAKNKETGKILTGKLNDLPENVYGELCFNLPLKRNALACATSVAFSYQSQFYKWFSTMHQCML
jgi:hypothetical protein